MHYHALRLYALIMEWKVIVSSTSQMGVGKELTTSITCGHFEGSIEIVGTLVFHLIAFYVPCGVYASLEVLFPAFSESHKIQPAEKQPSCSEVWECLKVVLRNQLLSFFLQLGSVYLPSETRHHPFRFDAKLPGMGEVVFQFVVCIILREVSFYYAH
ncbi:hypothetical protein BDN71DRAFT_1452578 [Pleurotus eryngii]|uniref:Uncharacterized protein n=1 Tax=Pleurotus eryngii TaxID=5323 RepID=A0A9P6D5B5_PLEER|nr:hypothetical protein BDN71DRAFT_1452578 [Pleurotus eryngii]